MSLDSSWRCLKTIFNLNMGYHSFDFEFDGSLSFADVRKKVLDRFEREREENGNRSEYHGCDDVRNANKTFTERDKAFEYVMKSSDHSHEAVAVRLESSVLPREILQKKLDDSKKLKRLKEKLDEQNKARDLAYQALAEKRKEIDFLKCSGCSSKISSKHMERVEVSTSVAAFLENGEVGGGHCPVCRENKLALPSREFKAVLKTELAIKAIKDSATAEKTKIRESLKSKEKPYAVWIVGGWARQ